MKELRDGPPKPGISSSLEKREKMLFRVREGPQEKEAGGKEKESWAQGQPQKSY